MVLEIKKWSNILKCGIFWHHFVDLLSLIQNSYKYSLLAKAKKSQNRF